MLTFNIRTCVYIYVSICIYECCEAARVRRFESCDLYVGCMHIGLALEKLSSDMHTSLLSSSEVQTLLEIIHVQILY